LPLQLAPISRVTCGACSGKTRAFCDGVMLIMVTEDKLYLRADAFIRETFKQAASFPPLNMQKRAAPSTSPFGACPNGCSTNQRS